LGASLKYPAGQSKQDPTDGFEYFPEVQFVHVFPLLIDPIGHKSSQESNAVSLSFEGPLPVGQLSHALPLKISFSEHIV
jgi:hypothetical protein